MCGASKLCGQVESQFHEGQGVKTTWPHLRLRHIASKMLLRTFYWGKPAVRNDRGDGGNVGIIRSPLRATVLPDRGGRADDVTVNLNGHEAGNGGHSQGTPTARRALLYSDERAGNR